MANNLTQLLSDIESAVNGIVNQDMTTLRGFSQSQLNAIANQTIDVATGIANGQIHEDDRQFFLDQLVALAKNFANTLIGLVVVTIEKVWNAIVGVLWSTISRITGLQLSVPES